MTVSVTLKMLGDLRQYLPAGSGFNDCRMQVEQGSDVGQLVASLKLPGNKSFLLMKNNELVHQHDYSHVVLSAGDEVVLFPPIKGG